MCLVVTIKIVCCLFGSMGVGTKFVSIGVGADIGIDMGADVNAKSAMVCVCVCFL